MIPTSFHVDTATACPASTAWGATTITAVLNVEENSQTTVISSETIGWLTLPTHSANINRGLRVKLLQGPLRWVRVWGDTKPLVALSLHMGLKNIWCDVTERVALKVRFILFVWKFQWIILKCWYPTVVCWTSPSFLSDVWCELVTADDHTPNNYCPLWVHNNQYQRYDGFQYSPQRRIVFKQLGEIYKWKDRSIIM